MSDLHTLGLIGSDGQPFDGRIAKVLLKIAPRLRREYPALEDDVVVTEVLEEAGRRIVQREAKKGPLERLYGFAWVTIQNVARTRLSTLRSRIARAAAWTMSLFVSRRLASERSYRSRWTSKPRTSGAMTRSA